MRGGVLDYVSFPSGSLWRRHCLGHLCMAMLLCGRLLEYFSNRRRYRPPAAAPWRKDYLYYFHRWNGAASSADLYLFWSYGSAQLDLFSHRNLAVRNRGRRRIFGLPPSVYTTSRRIGF